MKFFLANIISILHLYISTILHSPFIQLTIHGKQYHPLCRYYGCGLVFPSAVNGVNVLDFGSGAGRDCFILSKLVGEDGFVTGIDMTEEQVFSFNKVFI